jgi:hypothetical protein
MRVYSTALSGPGPCHMGSARSGSHHAPLTGQMPGGCPPEHLVGRQTHCSYSYLRAWAGGASGDEQDSLQQGCSQLCTALSILEANFERVDMLVKPSPRQPLIAAKGPRKAAGYDPVAIVPTKGAGPWCTLFPDDARMTRTNRHTSLIDSHLYHSVTTTIDALLDKRPGLNA